LEPHGTNRRDIAVCDVNPFLQSYQPVQEILVARCGTVWMDPDRQHVGSTCSLGGDQMFWFGTLLPNSLVHPNQMRAYGISRVYDDPFETSRTFGIDSAHAFIPFDTTTSHGDGCVHFESHVPTEWEKAHLPILYFLRARIGIHLKKCCVTGTKVANSRKCGRYIVPSVMTRRQN
jgi:hypothetical protein